MINFVKISCAICFLTSCTSYVWNPINYVELENNLSKKVGSDFTQAYSDLGTQHLFSETNTHEEYIYDEYSHCSWIVKVVKATNKIESWRYSYPERCENYKQGNNSK
jgi:hypothetical protein